MSEEKPAVEPAHVSIGNRSSIDDVLFFHDLTFPGSFLFVNPVWLEPMVTGNQPIFRSGRDDIRSPTLEFLAKGFLVKEHVRIAKLAVEAIFDMLDGLYDALEVRVAGKDNKCCAGLAVDASLVVEDTGREDVFRTLRAELIRDVLQRSSLAIFLMREAEDVMQTYLNK